MYRYLIFNKPYGVLTTFTDQKNRQNLKNYINIPNVYAAGRLDFDSEGLLLLTDNGRLIQYIIEPRYRKPKTYIVQVEGVITPGGVQKLEHGVTIQDYTTLPCSAHIIAEPELPERAKPVTPHLPTSWIQITIFEGRNRQIRHMTAKIGYPTLRLIRISIGPIQLGNLASGKWRWLTTDEIQLLTQPAKRSSIRRLTKNKLGDV